jgi:ectoine hydroxylase-related dioxygenase (phytanoyl-CoA dioxygenase family)
MRISEEQRRQFEDDGYFILERAVPEEMLQILREECSYFLGRKDQEMDDRGDDTVGITHKRKRYFISRMYRKSPRLWRFIYSDLMAEICRAALGEQAFLFYEQWVIKGAEVGMKFGWHQDSGYVKFNDPKTTHKPYLTCWTPLDDVDETNGTIYLLPHSRAGTKNHIHDHEREAGTNDLIGYTGDDPGVSVTVTAGSVACFSSTSFHRSGANTTNKMRRVYLTQYSAESLLRHDGKRWSEAVPFLKDGANIYNPDTDNLD